jgi:hypothetical protein
MEANMTKIYREENRGRGMDNKQSLTPGPELENTLGLERHTGLHKADGRIGPDRVRFWPNFFITKIGLSQLKRDKRLGQTFFHGQTFFVPTHICQGRKKFVSATA